MPLDSAYFSMQGGMPPTHGALVYDFHGNTETRGVQVRGYDEARVSSVCEL